MSLKTATFGLAVLPGLPCLQTLYHIEMGLQVRSKLLGSSLLSVEFQAMLRLFLSLVSIPKGLNHSAQRLRLAGP